MSGASSTRMGCGAMSAGSDDRITCTLCTRHTRSGCSAWREVQAIKGYAPDPGRLMRCTGYVPSGGDDRRTGAERWPNLKAFYLKKESKRVRK